MKTILDLHNIYYSYHTSHGETRALSNLSFSLAPGEFAAVVGPSGCGKSTLLSLICGLMKPQTGEILLNGEPVLGNSPQIGYMLQHDHLFEWRTIYRNILLGPEISHTLNKEIREKAKSMLTQYGLKSFIHARPSHLSGGMRQRIIIAVALACDPKLLIADEPTTALDVTVQAQILSLIEQSVKGMGASAIVITHDLGVVAELCDKIIIMYGGEIVERGTVREIFKETKHPYTRGLLDSIGKIEEERVPLHYIPGTPPNLLNLNTGCAFCSRCNKAMKICKDYKPCETIFSEEHSCSCWLYCKDKAQELVEAQERERQKEA